MTLKKDRILKAALTLFAQEGYHATSTSKVAKEAGVSEGLIFRHYINKEGLLNAIREEGQSRFETLYEGVIDEVNPQLRIKKVLEMPFNIQEKDYEFWKLQFKLKWELKHYNTDRLKPLRTALLEAFGELDAPQPELEAEVVLHLIDGIGSALLKGVVSDKDALKNFVIDKYSK